MLVRSGLDGCSICPKVRCSPRRSDGETGDRNHHPRTTGRSPSMSRMPEEWDRGIANTRRQKTPPPVLLLTTFDDSEVLIEGLRAGARGYMLKDVSLDQLLGAIETIASGGSAFLPGVTEHLLQNFTRGARVLEAIDRPHALTPRERTVLQLMTGGYSNREIAQALDTSEGTVKNHVSSILSKLGVRDRTRAALKAIADGLL